MSIRIHPRTVEGRKKALVQVTANELVVEREEGIIIEDVEYNYVDSDYPPEKKTMVTVQVTVNDPVAPEENYIVCLAARPKQKKSRRRISVR